MPLEDNIPIVLAIVALSYNKLYGIFLNTKL